MYLGHVGYGIVARFSYDPDREVGFESRLVKTGEGCPSKCGFKLRGRETPGENTTNIGGLKTKSGTVRDQDSPGTEWDSHLTSPLLVR